jgi:hypothetical protein
VLKIGTINDIWPLNVRTNQHGLLFITSPSYSFLGQKLTLLFVTSHLLSHPCIAWLMFFNLHWSLFFPQNGQCLTNLTSNIVLFAHTTYNWTWEKVKVIQSAQKISQRLPSKCTCPLDVHPWPFIYTLSQVQMATYIFLKLSYGSLIFILNLYHQWNMVVQSKFLKAWNCLQLAKLHFHW